MGTMVASAAIVNLLVFGIQAVHYGVVMDDWAKA